MAGFLLFCPYCLYRASFIWNFSFSDYYSFCSIFSVFFFNSLSYSIYLPPNKDFWAIIIDSPSFLDIRFLIFSCISNYFKLFCGLTGIIILFGPFLFVHLSGLWRIGSFFFYVRLASSLSLACPWCSRFTTPSIAFVVTIFLKAFVIFLFSLNYSALLSSKVYDFLTGFIFNMFFLPSPSDFFVCWAAAFPLSYWSCPVFGTSRLQSSISLLFVVGSILSIFLGEFNLFDFYYFLCCGGDLAGDSYLCFDFGDGDALLNFLFNFASFIFFGLWLFSFAARFSDFLVGDAGASWRFICPDLILVSIFLENAFVTPWFYKSDLLDSFLLDWIYGGKNDTCEFSYFGTSPCGGLNVFLLSSKLLLLLFNSFWIWFILSILVFYNSSLSFCDFLDFVDFLDWNVW